MEYVIAQNKLKKKKTIISKRSRQWLSSKIDIKIDSNKNGEGYSKTTLDLLVL